MFAITPFFSVNFAFATSGSVDTNVSFTQGLTKDGSVIDPSRSDATMALGMADGNFVSLGYEGEIVLAFPTHVGGGALLITATERTNGTYPLEQADVSVSSDGIAWIPVGIADNAGDDPRATTFDLGDICIKYVKLIDSTDEDLHGDSSDGFDLDAIEAEYESECRPEEPCEDCDSGNDLVVNNNSAFVMNRVTSHANTGGNTAGGSYGGDGGDGGDINGGEVEESATGSGGAGGDAGTGGEVYTGNAYASTDFYNEVNSSRTTIDRCACDYDNCCDEGHAVVYNRNRAIVMNDVSSMANTGDNRAEGSYAGRGGDGGSINPQDGLVLMNHEEGCGDDDSEVEESMTGDGGAGGNAAAGGLIQTGDSRSVVTYVNVVNTNITRILR